MDRTRYGSIKEELHNEYLKGQRNYPRTITDAYQLQQKYWIRKRPAQTQPGSATNFVNRGRNTNSNNGNEIECWTCGEKGHISPNCPKKNIKKQDDDKNNGGPRTATTNSQHNNNSNNNEDQRNVTEGTCGVQISTFSFLQMSDNTENMNNINNIQNHKSDRKEIKHYYQNYQCAMSNGGNETNPNTLKQWILLDSQSTIDIFCNETLLTKIHWVENGITLHTNGGILNVNWKGHLNNYGWV